jgi:hypothetical protein
MQNEFTLAAETIQRTSEILAVTQRVLSEILAQQTKPVVADHSYEVAENPVTLRTVDATDPEFQSVLSKTRREMRRRKNFSSREFYDKLIHNGQSAGIHISRKLANNIRTRMVRSGRLVCDYKFQFPDPDAALYHWA